MTSSSEHGRTKILLTGATGQVGWELRRSLAPLGQLVALDRKGMDLSNPDQIRDVIRQIRPGLIVNAAAYTAVDKAEEEVELATVVNATAPGIIAEEAARLQAPLIHFSTDYIFSGGNEGNPYVEEDGPDPGNVYGKTKLAGEQAIQKTGGPHLIFRTSWVYAARGSNFAKTMLRLAKEGDELNVVSDQVGVPTSAELIADITALCLYHVTNDSAFGKQAVGTYHLSPSGETNWHEYARYVIAEAQHYGVTLRAKPENIHPISTSEYPLPAKRPANSLLDTKKLTNTFSVHMPVWRTQVKRLVSELVMKDEL